MRDKGKWNYGLDASELLTVSEQAVVLPSFLALDWGLLRASSTFSSTTCTHRCSGASICGFLRNQGFSKNKFQRVLQKYSTFQCNKLGSAILTTIDFKYCYKRDGLKTALTVVYSDRIMQEETSKKDLVKRRTCYEVCSVYNSPDNAPRSSRILVR